LSVEENIDFFAELREVTPVLLAERKRKLLAMTRLDQVPGSSHEAAFRRHEAETRSGLHLDPRT